DLSILTFGGKPDLEVVLLGRSGTEIACRHVEHVIRETKAADDFFFDGENAFVFLVRPGGSDERKHLALVELVHAEDAPRVLPLRAGLAAEARGMPGLARGQLIRRQLFAAVQR